MVWVTEERNILWFLLVVLFYSIIFFLPTCKFYFSLFINEETMTQNISWLCQNQTANRGGPGIRNNLGLFTLMTLLFPPIKSSSNITVFIKILHSKLPLQNKKIYVLAKIFKDYFFLFPFDLMFFFFLEWVSLLPPPLSPPSPLLPSDPCS